MDSDSFPMPRTPAAWRSRELQTPKTLYQQPIKTYSSNNHHPIHSNGQFINSHSYHHSNIIHHPMNNNSNHHHHHHASSSSNQRTSSPSVLTTSSDDREEIPMVRHPPRRHHGGSLLSQTIDRRRQKLVLISNNQHRVPSSRGSIVSYAPNPRVYRTSKLRSTNSVPGLSVGSLTTWDGEPCPVHGGSIGMPNHGESTPSVMTAPVGVGHYHPHTIMASSHMTPSSAGNMIAAKRFNSLSDLHHSMNGSSITGGHLLYHNGDGGKQLDTKLPLPQFITPIMRPNSVPRPLTGGQIILPAPIGSLKNHVIAMNKMMPEALVYETDAICCKGQVIVIWIVIALLTIGVISGIILTVITN